MTRDTARAEVRDRLLQVAIEDGVMTREQVLQVGLTVGWDADVNEVRALVAAAYSQHRARRRRAALHVVAGVDHDVPKPHLGCTSDQGVMQTSFGCKDKKNQPDLAVGMLLARVALLDEADTIALHCWLSAHGV
tara:strand:+ start:1829 stop:2230 length:402 start_codon:yes stop_codon:yes gene_type:complete